MNAKRDLKVKKGSILIYRVFDIGEEINLSKVQSTLSDYKGSRFQFSKDNTKKSIVMSDAPLGFEVGPVEINLMEKQSLNLSAKVWNYGSLSLCFHLDIPKDMVWRDLIQLASVIDTSSELDEVAKAYAQRISSALEPAIQNKNLWHTFEDYVIYQIESVESVDPNDARTLLELADVAHLILAEPNEELAETSVNLILENAKQYSKTDLAIIDWNAAVIYGPEKQQKDVIDVIEFSLTHLLEMRYYDDLIDVKLGALYDSIQDKKGGKLLFSDFYSVLAEDASKAYIEFSEFLDRVDNSLKTVGDYYLATIFRTATSKFRFNDWKNSLRSKIDNLAQITELLQVEVNSRKSHFLEVVVIVLISGEIFAAALPWLKSLF